MYTIYLVEDDMNLNQILAYYLKQEGWQVSSFKDGEEARRMIQQKPDMWILDIMLPGMDGYQLLKEIKKDNNGTPIIFISARDADLDRIVGLELGSDDYLSKPFLPRELVIRTRKLLDRVYGHLVKEIAPIHSIEIAPYVIEGQARIVKCGLDGTIDLTSKEFDLLMYFVLHIGQLIQREQVLKQVWGDDYYGTDRVVDDLIRRLRKKMPELRLETVYGSGYRLVKT
ncbi:response regulator transcription factor [Paenibacillus terrigena]|uniref:response regulator transcription factor n=1 Tax=Paenibacillus terrigena TaxID=369333 RepID=UPI00037E8317|nr:response regulator transcription factor [Paenibacillus terrigena]